MGLFDRAKQWLGRRDDDDERQEQPAPQKASGQQHVDQARAAAVRRKDGRERPPLKEVESAPSVGIDDAIEARARGDREGAREILRQIDRGGGLRTVLRAAAALEANDERELSELLPVVAKEDPPWRLLLQTAAALGDGTAVRFFERAGKLSAPDWAIAWARALSSDEVTRREGLVDLLFADAPLARTVAARDLGIEHVVADAEAAQRYASFAHGRDSIRKFGAPLVARLLDRAMGPS